MSSNDEVIRMHPRTRLWKEPWPRTEVPDGHVLSAVHYYHALGKIITHWNEAEVYFRALIGHIAGMKSRTSDAVLIHVGSVTLYESLLALASEVVDRAVIKEELAFAAKLFDRNRENRNFIVHNARPLNDMFLAAQKTPGMLFTKRAAKGRLQTTHWVLAIETLRGTSDQIFDFCEYTSLLIGPCAHNQESRPIVLPPRPALPARLAKSHDPADLLTLMRTDEPDEAPPGRG